MDEPIACSPETNDGGMLKRKMINNDCSPKCKHYAECLKELKIGDDWVFPIWELRQATEDDMFNNLCFWDWESESFKTWDRKN